MKPLSDRDVADAIRRLSDLNAWDLRNEWQRLHRMPPPMRISRDLLIRGIAYKLQERAYGGLSKPMLRRLAELGNKTSSPSEALRQPTVVLKPGTRLVREWDGETHTVEVLEGQFRWRGRPYRSLSMIAKEITGAHWSGPRFFGLRKRKVSSTEEREVGDAEN